MFSCEFCELFKNTFFKEQLPWLVPLLLVFAPKPDLILTFYDFLKIFVFNLPCELNGNCIKSDMVMKIKFLR